MKYFFVLRSNFWMGKVRADITMYDVNQPTLKAQHEIFFIQCSDLRKSRCFAELKLKLIRAILADLFKYLYLRFF